MSMNLRHTAAYARCGSVGKPRQLNDLLRFDRNEPVVALCDQCLNLLKYADARTWEWFRRYRDRLISSRRQMNLRQPPHSRLGLVSELKKQVVGPKFPAQLSLEPNMPRMFDAACFLIAV